MNGKRLLRQLELSLMTIQENTKDLSDEDALCTPQGGGNHLNWVLGHILFARDLMLQCIGAPTVGGDEVKRRYERGSTSPSAADALPTRKIFEMLRSSQEPIARFLAEATGEAFERPIAMESEVLGKTVGDALTALAWHEGYHAGQIGLLRRVAGKPGAIA